MLCTTVFHLEQDTDRIINRCYFMFTHTFQEMKGFLMPGSKSSENILSRFCPVAFVILIENLVQTFRTVQKR